MLSNIVYNIDCMEYMRTIGRALNITNRVIVKPVQAGSSVTGGRRHKGGRMNWKEKLINQAYERGRADANKWYYPAKGEYPPKEQEYLVAFKTDKEIYCDVRVLNPDLNNLVLGIGEQIYAWQYILPPKEEAWKRKAE